MFGLGKYEWITLSVGFGVILVILFNVWMDHKKKQSMKGML